MNPFDERQLSWFTCEASDGSSYLFYIKPVVERKDGLWLHADKYGIITTTMKNAIILSAAVVCALPLFAKIELGTPFADHMVLQRGRPVPVWGKAAPGRTVEVSFADATVSAEVASDGSWRVALPAMEACKEPRTLAVAEYEPCAFWFSKKIDETKVEDVLVGEVWMCAGQSNTDCPIWGKSPRYRDGMGAVAVASTVKPTVRLVKTPRIPSMKPRFDYRVQWVKMTPDDFKKEFAGSSMPSAMGYYFALELANALDIPIGLVDSSWGGTNIDTWTPPSGYAGKASLADVAALPILPKAEFEAARASGAYPSRGVFNGYHKQPSMLWNGMVAAFAPMAFRGMIWYQGCSNSGEPQFYCDKMHALYDGWAKEFANPSMKLYFVQIVSWGHNIAPFQIAQEKFAKEEPNAAMAVINDVENLKDIHPNDKRTVAKRLALHALKRDYGFESICPDSPTPKSWKVEKGAYVVEFNDATGFYIYNDDRSLETCFEICDAAGNWHQAKVLNVEKNGLVNGSALKVAADGVADPRGLRYMFCAPWHGSLYGDTGLPVGAFEIK